MTKQEKIGVTLAVVVAMLLIGGGLVAGVSGNLGSPQAAVQDATVQETPSLVIDTLESGDGDLRTQAGDRITVHYVGRFEEGGVFDSSHSRGEPFTFTLGAGQVINGWDIGLQGMQVGAVRELTIPPGLAYGSEGRGPIPPNATLVFEVELLDIERAE